MRTSSSKAHSRSSTGSRQERGSLNGYEFSDSEAEQRAWEVLDFFWILSVGGHQSKNTNFDRPTPEHLP
jgi:hypothetical protein